jgi:hypothetical protein
MQPFEHFTRDPSVVSGIIGPRSILVECGSLYICKHLDFLSFNTLTVYKGTVSGLFETAFTPRFGLRFGVGNFLQ